ncbi:formylglycine-generating enzyme family protein [Conexibacter sp. JD483]|uniref:formylglycine-generating enzyme family protein n=1 Tax=unclassified Conexibacter TaxID=2627773 RepID=UPI00271A79BB|nr:MULTISPECIES: formylglycine-generating enzyme family protein [unclassified Conexibacter]MDO8186549.1 formylglycine-generating enzyme family protein [Conexibacter sp. CPCC 205706]MDO8200118.1 formylglycine-generating enzyme family protein [Conexibacter sp. CPCC 205762]MDR9372000.1 formylglycine-generating enzyme family protein [Conexibacter sp. JD483]
MTASAAARAGMVRLDGGTFRMGSEEFYPEEAPVHHVALDPFWIDARPVTVREFRRFAEATGHVTHAERAPDPAAYPGADPALLVAGSIVFRKPPGRVGLADWRRWWAWVPGADWRHPGGPGTSTGGRDRHPVVHVAHADAAAYAAWAGKALPTEAEWEYAARGGLDQARWAWGDEERPGGALMANHWQGEFPWENLKARGWEGTSPVGTFAPNGHGLYDMVGNTWEWTDDWYTHAHEAAPSPCCAPRNPRAEDAAASCHPGEPGGATPRRTIKGGSHLCAPNYCLRYRPAARQGEPIDTTTSHIGFRCVVRER